MKNKGPALWLVMFLFAQSALGQTLKLNEILDATRSSNPDIKAVEAKVSALEARKGASSNIPAPMVAISYMGADGPFRSDDMKEKPSFEVSQTIPFPTKILANMKLASRDFAAGAATKELEEKAVIASAKAAFWDYFVAYNDQKFRREQILVLKDHLKRISRSPVSDALANTHILSIKNEASVMENEVEQGEVELEKARNVLYVFTGLSKEKLSAPPEEPPLKDVSISLGGIQSSPALKKAQKEVESAEAGHALARSMYFPDLTVKYRWNSEFATVPKNQELMVGLDLPFVFFWQPRAQVHEARARLIETEAMQEKTRREVESSFSALAVELKSLKRQLDRLESEIIPQAERQMKIAHSISFTDMASLEEHRRVLQDSLKFRLQRLILRSSFEKKLAELEAIQGG